MLSVDMFSNICNIGFVFFGLHLGFLGYLVYKLDYSGFIHKVLGILLIIAGVGYLANSFGNFLVPDFDVNIAMFTFFGVNFMLKGHHGDFTKW